MIESYDTIKDEKQGYYEEKLSKFISYAFYVESEKKVKDILNKVRCEHKFARHIVYAYCILENSSVLKKYSDDGEPQKTAGFPLLSVLEKKNLTNVILIVVRYFGGTLLGAGPLARAYLSSAKDCVSKLEIITKNIGQTVEVEVEYKEADNVVNLIEKVGGLNIDIKYMENVLICFKITKQNLLYFNNSISKYDKVTNIYLKEECYI